MIEKIFDELKVFKKFNFEEEPHIYWWLNSQGERCQARISMTSLIHSYSQPFDKEKVSQIVAKKNNTTKEEILKLWEFENDFSKVKGTHIHAYNEYLWKNKKYCYPKEKVINEFGIDVLEPIWENLTKIADKFYKDFKDRLIPIGLELVIGDEEYSVCGSVDFLCYSIKLNSLIIIDYKSNKEIKLNSYKEQKMTGCLSHLEDCNYIHYSLQLNGYQHIIEKNTNLRLKNEHFLIWMNENNDDYKIYKTKDLKKEAIMMLEEQKGKRVI